MDAKTNGITTFIEEYVIADYSVLDLQDIINGLPEDNEEAASSFCNQIELGNWFYEAMIVHKVDISEVLIDVAEKHRQEDLKDTDDNSRMSNELRRSQGWPM